MASTPDLTVEALPVDLTDESEVGGWWRVDWKDGRRTFFRSRQDAMDLINTFSFTLPTWVDSLPEL